ncbi:MAG: hypothetical protein ABIK92_11150 [Pseudomonadota bacterium]
MNKKFIILISLTLIFAISTGYFGMQYIRFKSRNMYHRSRMSEYELWANLYKIFPVGTSFESFSSKLQLNKSAYSNMSKSQSIISDIFPELPIPKAEQRDYSCYYVQFKNGKLIRIMPADLGETRNKIRLSELGIAREIIHLQKP